MSKHGRLADGRAAIGIADGHQGHLIDSVPPADKPFDDPVADVRVAAYQCEGTSDDDKAALGRLAAMGEDPVTLAKALDETDARSRQDARHAVGAVDNFARQPKFIPNEVTDSDQWTASARTGMRSAISPGQLEAAKPHMRNLARRLGSFAAAVDNFQHLKTQAQAGGQAYQDARQTAHSFYQPWNNVNPSDAETIYDRDGVFRVFPDLNKSDHRHDDDLRRETIRIMNTEDFPEDLRGVELVHEARRRAFVRLYR